MRVEEKEPGNITKYILLISAVLHRKNGGRLSDSRYQYNHREERNRTSVSLEVKKV